MFDIRETETGWLIDLSGLTIIHFIVCCELYVDMGGPEFEISICFNDTFTYHSPSGPITVTPGEFETLPPVLALHRRELSRLEIQKAGRLTLVLADGCSMVAEPAEDYEAYEVSGNNGLMIVCPPGGEIAIWHPKLMHRIK